MKMKEEKTVRVHVTGLYGLHFVARDVRVLKKLALGVVIKDRRLAIEKESFISNTCLPGN